VAYVVNTHVLRITIMDEKDIIDCRLKFSIFVEVDDLRSTGRTEDSLKLKKSRSIISNCRPVFNGLWLVFKLVVKKTPSNDI
jgi:hypothetical protein